jgi:ABC-2 type transport system permease protein
VNAIRTIARRELKALFDHPTAYILLVVFIGINDFMFFRQAYLYHIASLRPMLDLLPWMLLFFVPAVTMRSLAEDARTGTIEVVLAQPLTEFEFLIGKYVGQVFFLWIALALTLPIPLALALGAPIQVGVVFAQYTGAALLTAGLAGVGVWASSVTKNQITSFILAVAVTFGLILVGLDPLLVGLPPTLGLIAARLGVLSHFSDIARGVIDLRDALYFATLAAVFLALAYFFLMRRRLAPASGPIRRLRLGTALMVAAMAVLNLFGGYIGGRLDLTPGGAYTLSGATKDILRNLDDLVTIKLFATTELPPEIALLRRDINDLLGDYRSAARGHLRVVVEDPAEDSHAMDEVRALGIPPVRFNVVGKSEVSVKEGYLGLAVRFADKSETIPLIQRTDDLEYRLTSMIRGFTKAAKKTVGLALDPGSMRVSYNTLREQLSKTYDVRDINLNLDTASVPQADAIVISGDANGFPPPAVTDRLRAFLNKGGGLLIMAGGMELNQQTLMASARPVSWNPLLRAYGVTVQANMVHDLASNLPVSIPTNFGSIMQPYPFWVMGLSTRRSVINAELERILLPWTSTIDTTAAPKGVVTPLIVSSNNAGVDAGQVFVSPDQPFRRDSLHSRVLGVLINARAGSDTALHGRLVVVGNSMFASDQRMGRGENLAFVLNSVDWLAQDEALIAIRNKDRTPPNLAFSSATKQEAAKYLNVAGVPFLIIVGAALRLWRRREMTRRAYRPGGVV